MILNAVLSWVALGLCFAAKTKGRCDIGLAVPGQRSGKLKYKQKIGMQTLYKRHHNGTQKI